MTMRVAPLQRRNLEWLQDEGGPSCSLEFALLRGDPRVKALRKKVGLPE